MISIHTHALTLSRFARLLTRAARTQPELRTLEIISLLEVIEAEIRAIRAKALPTGYNGYPGAGEDAPIGLSPDPFSEHSERNAAKRRSHSTRTKTKRGQS
jgi:hypothetical protein